MVRGIRRRLHLTQAALAARLGVAQMTVSRWESGGAPVRGVMRVALAAVEAAMRTERARARARAKRRAKTRAAKPAAA